MPNRKKPSVPIVFPTWKMRQHPTPNDTLVVCDRCGRAEWVAVRVGYFNYCGHHRPHSRMRRATPAETEQGKKALKEVVGS